MRYLLLLFFLVSISAASLSQIGYAEFPENSSLENWKIGKFNNVNGTIVNLGLKSGTYVIHWKFNVDSAFWNSQKVLHIANPIIDDVEVFQVTSDTVYQRSSGEKIPLFLREYNISGNAVNIEKSNDNIVDFYLKAVSYTHLTLPTKRIV